VGFVGFCMESLCLRDFCSFEYFLVFRCIWYADYFTMCWLCWWLLLLIDLAFGFGRDVLAGLYLLLFLF